MIKHTGSPLIVACVCVEDSQPMWFGRSPPKSSMCTYVSALAYATTYLNNDLPVDATMHTMVHSIHYLT